MPRLVYAVIGLAASLVLSGCAIPDGGYYGGVNDYQSVPDVVVEGGYVWGPGGYGRQEQEWHGDHHHDHDQYHQGSVHVLGNHATSQGHGHEQHNGNHKHK